MDVKTIKLGLIEWLARLQDSTLLYEIQKIKENAEVKSYEDNLKPMTEKQLIDRAHSANQDIKNGKVIDIEDMANEDWDDL